MTKEQEARLTLARSLRESADHSAEQELRDALSRSYYSLYHAARVWVGKERGGLGHAELQKQVEQRDKELAATIKELYRLRENADYNAEMMRHDYGDDLERFRLAVSEALERGRGAYYRIVAEIASPESGRE